MRRALTIIIILLTTNSLLAGIADVQLSTPDQSATVGETVTIPVQVTDLSGYNIIAYEFTVSYPDAYLTYTGFEKTNSMSSNGTIMDNPSTGSVKIGGIFVDALSGAGDLLYLNFTADQEGGAALSFSEVTLNTTALTALSGGTVSIQASNEPPQFSGLPASFSFPEDESTEIDMTLYISDPDHATGDLQTSVSILSGSGLNTSVSGNAVTLHADANVHGTWDMEITVEDPAGLQVMDTVGVEVTPVNDAPVIDALADTTITENQTLEYSINADDVDGDNLTFTCEEDPNAVTASMSGNTMSLTPSAEWYGTTNVCAIVSDGTLSDSTEFALTINPEPSPGDVDNNGEIEAYDAAITGQYSANMDPLPAEDPRPWSQWRLDRADVDGDGSVLAYDASLILQHVLGISSISSVANGTQHTNSQEDQPTLTYTRTTEGLTISAANTRVLYGANLLIEYDSTRVTFNEIRENLAAQEYEFVVNDITGSELHLAFMTASPPRSGEISLSLPFDQTEETSVEIREILNNGDPIYHTLDLTMPTGIDQGTNLPVSNELQPNFPNPFNPTTTIRYGVKQPAPVTLQVYSVQGELVQTLVREWQGPGYHDIVWNGTDQTGNRVASGVYFYRLTIGNIYQDVRRMLLLK